MSGSGNPIAKLVDNGGGSKYIIVQDSTGATVKRAGNRNWRNNNPGNLQGSSFSYSQPGVIGKDFYGDPVFDTYENGLAAQTKLIFGPSSVYRPLTVEQALYKYTPPVVEKATGQRGDPEGYLKQIFAAVPGISRSTPWSSLTPAQQQGILKTMHKVEGYKVGTISPVDPSTITPAASSPSAPSTSSNKPLGPNAPKPGPGTSKKVEKDEPPGRPSQVNLGPPIPNPLHQYASYTYGLSLALMTIKEFNEVVAKQTYSSKRVIIASAGRHNSAKDANDPNMFVRAPYFAEDFFFENLNINTVIGLNSTTRATNAIKTSFTIIEPHGMTLVDRIIKLCSSPDVMARNYIEQPYMLQIDFFGIGDDGVIVAPIPDQTKRIPIRILTMSIKATNKGTEYQIEACPYSHSAFDTTTLSTPAHFEVVAGTVASFFQSTEAETSLTKQVAQREKTATTGGLTRDEAGNLVNSQGQIVPLTAIGNASSEVVSADPIYKVKSYGSAYNAWQADQQRKNKIKYADKIFFKFDPEINDAKFVLGKDLSPKDTPMAEASDITMRVGNIPGSKHAALDYTTQVFSINTGTTIDSVINYVVRHSDYIQNQLVVPEDCVTQEEFLTKKKGNKELPLKWFKIIPQVIIPPDGYDTIRKVWAREITYNVIVYEIFNTKIASAPQGVWTVPTKEYNYFYTGRNVDVLEFNLEFNALYFTAQTAYKKNMAATYGLTEYDDRELNPENYTGIDDPNNAIQPMKEKPGTLDSQTRATGPTYTPKAAAAADVQGSLYTTAGGDMIQGKLKIIGDPHFIKQDDAFYRPTTVIDPATGKAGTPLPTSDPRLINSGSLSMDAREVYIQVKFKTPTDIDEVTGLMRYDTDLQHTSGFSGMFKVIQVDNTFQNGKFEQVLDIVRLPRQTSLDYVTDNQTKQRDETPIPTNNSLNTSVMTPINTDIAPLTAKSPTTKTAGDEKAPGSAPIAELPAPVQSAEQVKLAETAANAPEKPITAATEEEKPAAIPPPTGPSPEKLALKERADALEVIKNNTNREYNAASDRVAELSTQIDSLQIRLERYESNISDPNASATRKEEAQNNLATVKNQISALQSQLPAAEAEERRLRPLNLKASSDFVEAKSAYARAS